MKTWQLESGFVFLVLLITVLIKGFSYSEVTCGLAVWMTFMHGQIADRMQRKQSEMDKPSVDCYKWSNRYFIGKEILWIAFFLMVHSYSAIVGSIIFFCYPFWRRYYTRKGIIK